MVIDFENYDAVFNHTAHKALWNWLAENPGKQKIDWPGWVINGHEDNINYCYYCFACDYDDEIFGDCEACPLQWPDKPGCGECANLYVRWYKRTASVIEKSKLAQQIANLPVKEGVKTI